MSPFALNRRTFLEGAATLAAVAPGLTKPRPSPVVDASPTSSTS